MSVKRGTKFKNNSLRSSTTHRIPTPAGVLGAIVLKMVGANGLGHDGSPHGGIVLTALHQGLLAAIVGANVVVAAHAKDLARGPVDGDGRVLGQCGSS